MSPNDILFNPPIARKKEKKERKKLKGFCLKEQLTLPFSSESMTGDGSDLLLTGKEGRIRYSQGKLSAREFHPHYTISPTYFAGRSAAISAKDGSVGIFYGPDGGSHYRLRSENPHQHLKTKATSLLQVASDGLLVFEKDSKQEMGRLLYHGFKDHSKSSALPFMAKEEIIYFKPGTKGALALLDGESVVQLALIAPDLSVRKIPVAARSKYLFAPGFSTKNLYLVEGRTLIHISFAPDKKREELAVLDKQPISIWMEGQTLTVVYQDWSVDLFQDNQKSASFDLERKEEILSVAQCSSGLAARTERDLLIFSC